MDNIDRMMKEADRLGFGVSYGKYRAAYPNGSADVLSPPTESAVLEASSFTCRCCGKTLEEPHGNQIYCSEECRHEVKKKRDREYYRRRSSVPSVAMCAICGGAFKPKSCRSRYCCKECAEEGARKTSVRWRAARKKGDADGVSL